MWMPKIWAQTGWQDGLVIRKKNQAKAQDLSLQQQTYKGALEHNESYTEPLERKEEFIFFLLY